MGTDRYDRSYSIEQMYPSIPGKCSCGCGAALTGRRRRWASDKCATAAVDLFLIRKGNSDTNRKAVFKRDKGVCARCGKNTPKEQANYQELTRYWRWHIERMLEQKVTMLPTDTTPRRIYIFQETNRIIAEHLKRETGVTSVHSHWWEAHHKTAVVEGGGGCDLEGYETLCLPCHKGETKELRKRLNASKQKAFQGELGAQ